MKYNIALIGMPGSSKSTVGKLLAKSLNMIFADSDSLVEYELSYTIPQLFSLFGEAAFRREEGKIIQRLASYENIVISTGGGVVLNEISMNALQSNSYIVYLKSDINVLLTRLQNDNIKRPLLDPLTAESLTNLFESRKNAYESYANTIIDTTTLTPLKTKNAIIRYLKTLV